MTLRRLIATAYGTGEGSESERMTKRMTLNYKQAPRSDKMLLGSHDVITDSLYEYIETTAYHLPRHVVMAAVVHAHEKRPDQTKTPDPPGWKKGDEGRGWEDACSREQEIDG